MAQEFVPFTGKLDAPDQYELFTGTLDGEKPRKRTWGEAATDAVTGAASGAGGLVKSVGELGGLATGNMDNPVTELGDNAQQYWDEKKSDPLKAKIQQRQENMDAQDTVLGKAWTGVKDTMTDPALAMDTVSSNAATMVPGAVAGKIGAGFKLARGLAAAEAADGAITAAGREAAEKAAGSFGTKAGIVAGGVQQGADVSQQAYDDAMAKPDAVWDSNPAFQAALSANGGDRNAAKQQIATESARATFLPATGISVAANALPGADYLERALVGRAALDTVENGVKYAIPKAMAKGALGEGTQEFIEEGGGQLAANVANQQLVDPNQNLGQNVGENAGLGFAGGALFGGAAGSLHAGHTDGALIDEGTKPNAGGPDSGATGNASPSVDPGYEEIPRSFSEAAKSAGDYVQAARAPKPSEQMGIDPNAGPLSDAAAHAVDTGVSDHFAQQSADNTARPLADLQSSMQYFDQQEKLGGLDSDLADAKANTQAQIDTIQKTSGSSAPTDHGANWSAMAPKDRQSIADQAGVNAIARRSLPGAEWESIAPAVQQKLASAMQKQSAANADAIESSAHEAATSPENDLPEPTQAQKEAGNYKKGHLNVQGLDISVENPRGSERIGVRDDGSVWRHTMSDHYGYIKRTVGADSEQVNAYIGPQPEAEHVYVVDQLNQKTNGFDEHKAMIGFPDQASAEAAYRSNFDPGWKTGPVHAMSINKFKSWLKDGDTSKPMAQHVAQNQEPQSASPVAESRANAPEALADEVANVQDGARPDTSQKLSEADAGFRDWYHQNRANLTDELFIGGQHDVKNYAALPSALRNRAAHGMSKSLGSALRDLRGILNNGIDPNRGGGKLYTAPLGRPEQNTGGGTTAGGNAYSDGAFSLIAREGVNDGITDINQVEAIVVNSSLPDSVVSGLQKEFPSLKIGRSSDVQAMLAKTKPTTEADIQVLQQSVDAMEATRLKQIKNGIQDRTLENKEVANVQDGALPDTNQQPPALEAMTDKQLHDRISYLRGSQQVTGPSKEIDAERAALKSELARRAEPQSAKVDKSSTVAEIATMQKDVDAMEETRRKQIKNGTQDRGLEAKIDAANAQIESKKKQYGVTETHEGYEARWRDRAEQAKSAKTEEEVIAIRSAELNDPERHSQSTVLYDTEDALRKLQNEKKQKQAAEKTKADYAAGEWVDSGIKSNSSGSFTGTQAQAKKLSEQDPAHEYDVEGWNDSFHIKMRKKPEPKADSGAGNPRIEAMKATMAGSEYHKPFSDFVDWQFSDKRKPSIAKYRYSYDESIGGEHASLMKNVGQFASGRKNGELSFDGKLPAKMAEELGLTLVSDKKSQKTPVNQEITQDKPAEKAPVSVSENKIFTAEAAEKAREILRKKLNGSQLNSGVDPEVLQAGMALAGYHIEKGARTFAAYSKAMIDDLGDMVKPYLKSWYMGVKYDPRAAGLDGMSSAAEVESAVIEDNSPSNETAPSEQFTHAGVMIYPIRVRGQEVSEKWAVQSIENADREKRGVRQIGGDDIVNTRAEAMARAEENAAKHERETLAKSEQEKSDRQKEEAQKKAVEAGKIKGIEAYIQAVYADNKLTAGMVRKTLSALIKANDGKVSSKAEWVDKKLAEGGQLVTREEDKIKPMTRAQFNRADNREQEAHEKRIKEAGKKTVYSIENGDMSWEITKTEYDYGKYIQKQNAASEKKPSKDSSTPSKKTSSSNAATTEDQQHIEGGKVEEVTGEVIRESIAKSALKTPFSLKTATAWITKEVDAAIAKAPTKVSGDASHATIQFIYADGTVKSLNAAKRKGHKLTKNEEMELAVAEKELPILKAKMIEAGGHVIFDIPGDGKFRVKNTKDSLASFKANVLKAMAYKGAGPLREKVAQNSPVTTLKDMIGENEMENAYHFAKLHGDVRFGLGTKVVAYGMAEDASIEGIDAFVGLSFEEGRGKDKIGIKNQPDTRSKKLWYVIEPRTGMSMGDGAETKEKAISLAKLKVKSANLEQLKSHIEANAKNDTMEDRLNAWAKQENIDLSDEAFEPTKVDAAKTDEKKPQSTADKEAGYRNGILIAADSVEKLRPQDVDRVLVAAYEQGEDQLAGVTDYIVKSNIKLMPEVRDFFEEIAVFLEDTTDKRIKHFVDIGLRRLNAADLRESIAKKFGDDLAGLQLEGANERFAFLLPDASEQGKVRATYFDANGLSGHTSYDTYAKALDDVIQQGYRKESPYALDRMSQLQTFKDGNEWASKIHDMHLGKITWADMVEKKKGKAHVSTVEGQKELAHAAASIASIKMMNEQLKAIDPNSAWTDKDIEQNIDQAREAISIALVEANKPKSADEAKSEEYLDIERRLEAMSSAEVRKIAESFDITTNQKMHSELVAEIMEQDFSKIVFDDQEDLKGFEKTDDGDGDFTLRDGNMVVKVYKTDDSGKYQARFKSAKSSPHLQGVSGAVAWADALRTESKRIDSEEKKTASKTPIIDQHNAVMVLLNEGKLTPEQFKAEFNAVDSNADAIKAELATLTKAELLTVGGGWIRGRYANEAKPRIISAIYRQMLGDYIIGESLTYGMGNGAYEAALRQHVEGITAEKLASYAESVAKRAEERRIERENAVAGLANPKTVEDFRAVIRHQKAQGKTFTEARMTLSPEQRAEYDRLEAETTRESRLARKRAAKTSVKAAGQTVGGEIIATKHTKKGHDLYVVQLAERVSKEDYGTLNNSAKRLGGYYSSFRGNGAIPGFQFTDRENADAFLKLAAGDTAAAKDVAEQRRDAFEDDRSQSATERLNEMANRLDDRADEALNADRKTNTHRRAAMAARAEGAANADKALAETMRNLAKAIDAEQAEFLDAVRQKSQVELLEAMVKRAQDNVIRAKYPNYGDQLKHAGENPTSETADYAEFPSFAAYRSDLASLARKMLEVDGTKKLGQRLMTVADDVSDAYIAFAKDNLLKVSGFSRGDGMADYTSVAAAEKAISHSNLVGKAIVLPIKRGLNRIVISPSEAINKGIWNGDNDKRITLSKEFGMELVQAIGRRGNKSNGLVVPWQLETAADRLKSLDRMGIETPAEFRSAMREFIALRQPPAAADKVKEMERAMIGRKNDGLDFFPTPSDTADAMIDAAELKEGMSVLEPSAGMGHIAERIRAAGIEPDVIEAGSERTDLLKAKGFNVIGPDFMQEHGQYDRIIMNPPFSDRRDAEHVRHAYDLLKPGGRLVSIMGEGVFFGKDKKAQEFRDWLESVGGTDEKLSEGTFLDPSLPVNTGTNARMVVIDKSESAEAYSAPVQSPLDNTNEQPVSNSVPEVKRATSALKNNIEDFGEKLEGARKDYAQKLSDAQKIDVASEPLSKSWPEPDYNKLLESGADPFVVGWVHACRDEVPTKPKKGWKLAGWVKQVEALRDTSIKLLSGEISKEKLLGSMSKSEHENVSRTVGGRAELYERLGHDTSFKGITVSKGEYSYYNGVPYSPAKVIWAVGPDRDPFNKSTANADTRQEAIDAYVAKHQHNADTISSGKAKTETSKATKFDMWSMRGNGTIYVGKKIGKNYIKLKSFDNQAAAREYRSTHQQELEDLLKKYKETPFERNSENRPRVGADHRNGSAVTPEAFDDAFGFRGVQFGNYVESTRRQQDLDNAYDALSDLAALMNIPTKALSLDKKLGLAFGARGRGGARPAAAHYEPDTVVINLTKGNGAGSLAHEWFHAVDNYFAKLDNSTATSAMMTNGSINKNIRPEMVAAFNDLTNAIKKSDMRRRSIALDKRRTTPYWSTYHEMAARAFESYVIQKLQSQNAANDYLANIAGEEYWKAEEALLGHENEDTYPYPTEPEMESIGKAFDNFIATLKTKETASGVALFSRGNNGNDAVNGPRNGSSVSTVDADEVIARVSAGWADGRDNIELLDGFDSLPSEIRHYAKVKGIPRNEIKGVFHKGKVLLVRENLRDAAHVEETLFHEAYGHKGLAALFGLEHSSEMNRLYMALGGSSGLVKYANKYGINLRDYVKDLQKETLETRRAVLTEELLAHMAQDQSRGIAKIAKEIIGKIRAWLREKGFLSMAKANDFDLMHILAESKKAAISGKGSNEGMLFSLKSPVWRSALLDEVSALPTKSAPAFSWKQQITSLINKGKVKQAEVEATGLYEYIDLAARPMPDGVSYVYDYYGDPLARELAHDAKDGDEKAIKEMARAMAAIITKGSTLIPIPSRTGKADMALKLAMHIADITGDDIANVLTGNKRESLYDLKKAGKKISPSDLGFATSRKDIQNPVLIDNVFATGVTLDAARAAIPGAKMVAFARDTTAMPHKPSVITKQQIIDYLDANGVQVQETMLGAGNVPAIPDGWTIEETDDGFEVLDEEGEFMGVGATREQAIRDSMDADELADNPDVAGDTKFSQYVLPGGENYRELLLTLPSTPDTPPSSLGRIETLPNGRYLVTSPGGQRESFPTMDAAIAETERLGRIFNKPTPAPNTFKSSHYDQPNILAHVRFNERTDADGKRVLFLEELQSDWAQEGRKNGFGAGEKEFVAKELEKYGVIPSGSTSVHKLKEAGVPDDVIDRWWAAYMQGNYTVPSAPFVTSTDAWVTLAMKRMISYAAQNDFDRVAWTTGEQQADRYDLSKQVDKIVYVKDGDVYHIDAIQGRDKKLFSKEDMPESEIQDIVGKEIAKKIIAGEGAKPTGKFPYVGSARELSGADLKVGGEGMKSFYDRIVPKVAKDVLKKIGGGQLQQVEFVGDDAESKYVLDAMDITMDHDEEQDVIVRDRRTLDGVANFTTINEAEAWLDKNDVMDGTTSQTGFDITPAMREAVKGGLPLFSRGGNQDVQDIQDIGDEENGDTFSRSSIKAITSKVTEEVNKTFSVPGKLNWWHKTVGTMYNLAERSPAFKRVFDAAQGYIDDVSHYANDAAEAAPKLLPRLDTWRDIMKSPITGADNTAISKPIFEGTLAWARDSYGLPVKVRDLEAQAENLSIDEKAERLIDSGKVPAGIVKAWRSMSQENYEKSVNERFASQMLKPGIVWRDNELRSMFSLNDEQIGQYHEFRNSVNRSLDTMARADMLRFGGEDVKDLKDAVMDADDVHKAAIILRRHLKEMAQNDPDRETHLLDMAHGMAERAGRVDQLQAEGYAPLSRFGKYTVDVVENGTRQYFGLFETRREANIMAANMRKEFGIGSVSQGTLSAEEYKMFAGITPESLELFGNMLGLNSSGDEAKDKAFQDYLRLTKTNRSAMKRLIHRQGIAGYSENVPRVLAQFIYSNARQTAAGLNMGELGDAINEIPKEQGELKDAAIRLGEYVKNPQEEAQEIRGLLFAQYLGGSIASAFVNMTQPIALSFPYLSQYGGARNAASHLGLAAKQMGTKGFQYDPELKAALHLAEEDGTVSPQEVHDLMAQASGRGSLRSGDGTQAGDAMANAQNALARLSVAWGKVFGAAEQANRRVTFIAAYRIAKENGIDDPAEFARKAVVETQFQYSKANKMVWGRGAVGGTLMTFKTYSIAYLELLHRMYTQGGPEGKKAALLALGVMMLMGGAGGLPFEEDLQDAAEGLAQMLGYNISIKQQRRELLEEAFGYAGASFIEHGITGLPGMPLDVSGRLGMGNLIPGTGLLKSKADHTRDVLELAGPIGDFAGRAFSGAGKALTGDVAGGLLEASPLAVRNAVKGIDMASSGMYKDQKGYKVLDTNPVEAGLKSVGFQPNSVARIQEANAINQQQKSFYNLTASEIRSQWAQGIFDGDPSKVQEARARIADWNEKNPDQRMIITVPSVMHKVHEMRKTKDERIAATAPKSMRAKMREYSSEVRAE